jgi:hypothetical protein
MPLNAPQKVVLDLAEKTFHAFDTDNRFPEDDMENLRDVFHIMLVAWLDLPSAPGGFLYALDQAARELEREEGGEGGERGNQEPQRQMEGGVRF